MRAIRPAIVLAATAVAVPHLAHAQTEGVAERIRAGEGVSAGGFVLFPTLEAEIVRNDNIFAAEQDAQDDTVYTLTPQLDVRSNWNRHALGLNVRGVSRTFADVSSQDTFETFLAANGRLDVRRSAWVFGELGHVDAVEPLTEAPSVGLVEPTAFSETRAALGARIGFNRLAITGEIGVDSFDYDDNQLASGAIIDQDDRDRTKTEAKLRADYEARPGTRWFVSVAADARDYDAASGATAVDRDADGYEVLGGVNLDLSNLLRGEAGIGYFSQDVSEPGADDADGFSARIGLQWLATPILTLSTTASRGVTDAGVSGSTSAVETDLGVRADWEARRNLALDASLGRVSEEFRGVDREDQRTVAGVGALYRLNRIVGVTARYTRVSRNSDGLDAGADYDQNTFSLGLRAVI